MIGLDVHASSVRLAAVRGDELLDERTLPYEHDAVERAVRRWSPARCCYEAGPTGFGLYRHLVARGIECVVVAPGLVPQRPGDRIKTDPRDARKLAQLHAGGLLEAIHVPTPELEAARDLIRAREDARIERMRARHRLGKLLLRNDRRMPTKCWVSLAAAGSGSSASWSRHGRRRSMTTCTRSTSSTHGSRPSSERSRRWPSLRPLLAPSRVCVACAGSTR
jgi:hypothetical protein